MATKTFKVALSLDNPRIIQSGITVQSFDKQSVKISIALTKDSQTYQIPIGATIRISLLKLSNQAQKIIVDVPNDNRESIDWIVPDYLDGYHGVVRCGVYLLHGTESVDLGYFTILSNVSDIDKMAEEFTDNVFGGWEAIEEELRELNITIAQTKLDLAEDTTQVNNTIANINAKNTQVNTLASDFTGDVATKQADVASKYNAFDASVTTANQTIDDILGLADDVQQVSAQLAEKVQNFKLKNEIVNGDFADGLTGWAFSFASDFSVVSGKLSIVTGSIRSFYPLLPLTIIAGKKYYVQVEVSDYVSGTLNLSSSGFAGSTVALGSKNGVLSAVVTAANANNLVFALTNSANMKMDNIKCIELSSIFGVGNEPNGSEMDELMKVIPNGWRDGELDLTQQQYVNWLLSFIREKANKTQEAWITPTLSGLATEYGSGFSTVGYYKDEFGIVHLKGTFNVEATNVVLFTLPVGYRPSENQNFAVLQTTSFGFIRIYSDGRVQHRPSSGTANLVSLDGITFRAEG